jgi:hypothetical protein
MRKKLKARDKKAHKMTSDGLVERNAATGEELRLSKREAELGFCSEKVENSSSRNNVRAIAPRKQGRKQAYRQAEENRVSEPDSTLQKVTAGATALHESKPNEPADYMPQQADPKPPAEPPVRPERLLRLQFTQVEAVPVKPLTSAKRGGNIPQSLLSHSRNPKPPSDGKKTPLPLHPVEAAGSSVLSFAHKKFMKQSMRMPERSPPTALKRLSKTV